MKASSSVKATSEKKKIATPETKGQQQRAPKSKGVRSVQKPAHQAVPGTLATRSQASRKTKLGGLKSAAPTSAKKTISSGSGTAKKVDPKKVKVSVGTGPNASSVKSQSKNQTKKSAVNNSAKKKAKTAAKSIPAKPKKASRSNPRLEQRSAKSGQVARKRTSAANVTAPKAQKQSAALVSEKPLQEVKVKSRQPPTASSDKANRSSEPVGKKAKQITKKSSTEASKRPKEIKTLIHGTKTVGEKKPSGNPRKKQTKASDKKMTEAKEKPAIPLCALKGETREPFPKIIFVGSKTDSSGSAKPKVSRYKPTGRPPGRPRKTAQTVNAPQEDVTPTQSHPDGGEDLQIDDLVKGRDLPSFLDDTSTGNLPDDSVSQTKGLGKSTRLRGTFHLALKEMAGKNLELIKNDLAKAFLSCSRVKGILSHIQNAKNIRHISEEHAHDVFTILMSNVLARLDRPENVYSVIYAIAQLHARTVTRKEDMALSLAQDPGEETMEQIMARQGGDEGSLTDDIEDVIDKKNMMSAFEKRLQQVGWPSGLPPREEIKLVKAPGRRRANEVMPTDNTS